jgi:hypothetical protein
MRLKVMYPSYDSIHFFYALLSILFFDALLNLLSLLDNDFGFPKIVQTTYQYKIYLPPDFTL